MYERSDISRRTPHTVGSAAELLAAIAEVRRCGFSLVDQELEIGVRSVAAVVRDARGRAVAAVNVSTHVGRTDLDEMHAAFTPRLVATAAAISEALALR